jgi:hypothetical protein
VKSNHQTKITHFNHHHHNICRNGKSKRKWKRRRNLQIPQAEPDVPSRDNPCRRRRGRSYLFPAPFLPVPSPSNVTPLPPCCSVARRRSNLPSRKARAVPIAPSSIPTARPRRRRSCPSPTPLPPLPSLSCPASSPSLPLQAAK